MGGWADEQFHGCCMVRPESRCLPDTMQVEELYPLPDVAEEAVAEPAGQRDGPQDYRDLNQVPQLLVAGPKEGRRIRGWKGCLARTPAGAEAD